MRVCVRGSDFDYKYGISNTLKPQTIQKPQRKIKMQEIFCLIHNNRSTSLAGTEVIDLMWDEIGNTFSSSSMTTHALQEARDNKNRSLKRPVASEWDSVRNLSWTSCKQWSTRKLNLMRLQKQHGKYRPRFLNTHYIYFSEAPIKHIGLFYFFYQQILVVNILFFC